MMQCYSSIYYPFLLKSPRFSYFPSMPNLRTGCRSYYLWTWLYTDWNGIFYPSSLGDKTTSGSQYVVGQEEALWDHLTGISIKVLPSIFSPVFHAASLLLQTNPRKCLWFSICNFCFRIYPGMVGEEERVGLSKSQFMWALCAVHECFFFLLAFYLFL